MAVFIETNVISDPDQLGFEVNPASFAAGTEEILIDTTNKIISLKVTGNLTNAGATIKAVYSKLKDAWRVNTTLIRFPFPMGPITDEQFEMINGWNWDKTNDSGTAGAALNTTELLRTGGWSVVTGGAIVEQWTGVITLGALGDPLTSTDQVYYQQVGPNQASVNFALTGKVNQAVQIYSDPNGDGNTADGYDRRNYFKIFVREWQKLYAQSEIADIGVSQQTFQAYRYPLTNAADLKVTATEVQVDANADGTPDVGVFANVRITYLRDANGDVYDVRGDFASATVYAIGDVVRDTGNSRWYKCILGYTSTATLPSANTTNWAAYEGERQIGANFHPYTVIIDGDTTVGPTVSGAARTNEIYTSVQYFLRQGTDIDNGGGLGSAPIVTGKTANSLLRFVGDTLVTSAGVYIESFNSQDTNAITFTDATNVPRNFPFVAALTVNFGTNLQDDQYSKYWVFFTTNPGGNFGTADAIIVDDADNNDMAGDVNPAWPTKRQFVSHTFNYDSNVQGGRTAGQDAGITVVGIGLTTSQYVLATGNIGRSVANSVTLTSSLERNYAQGTTFP
jgi:hypothetical protein